MVVATGVEASSDAASGEETGSQRPYRGDGLPTIIPGASPPLLAPPCRWPVMTLPYITMLGWAMTLSIPDFYDDRRHPKPNILGVLSQYAVMPLVGWSGRTRCRCPSSRGHHPHRLRARRDDVERGQLSAKATSALSVSMTAFSTMLAPIITPQGPQDGRNLHASTGWSMALSIVQIKGCRWGRAWPAMFLSSTSRWPDPSR